jgi:hypothetical protein
MMVYARCVYSGKIGNPGQMRLYMEGNELIITLLTDAELIYRPVSKCDIRKNWGKSPSLRNMPLFKPLNTVINQNIS